MKIELTGWRAHNLRGYLRDVDIDLTSSNKKWILLQMPNGTGKTTTMELLRAAFSGQGLNTETIRSLKADDMVEDGFFEMSLLIDQQPLHIEIEFDFRREQCAFYTTRSSEKSGGRDEGHILPWHLDRMLSKDTTELFIFNGELAAEIIDSGRDRADTAIRYLYQLDQLEYIKKNINTLAEQRQKRALITAASTLNSVRRFKAEVDAANEVLNDLKNSRRELERRLNKSKDELKKIKQDIENHELKDSRFQSKMKSLKPQIEDAKRNIAELGVEALGAFRVPPRFHPVLKERLSSLGSQLTKLRLPRTMSAEFFLQLADGEVCVCNRPIGLDEKTAITQNASNFLGHDQVAVINQMKLALREESQEVDYFDEIMEKLVTVTQDLKRFEQQKEHLEEEMAKSGEDRFVELRRNKNALMLEINRKADALYGLTHVDTSQNSLAWESNIPLCEKELNNRERKYRTASGTYTFTEKTKKLTNLVTRVEKKSLKLLRERIRSDTNKTLEKILRNEQLRVSEIMGHLHLTTPLVSEKSGVSEGQKLAVSYAFLTALLAKAPYDLPFVVDSPAVSLDIEIRRTVGEFIPDLFKQMIMFVISSEREGFADSFYDRNDAGFITIALDEGTGKTEVREGIEDFQDIP